MNRIARSGFILLGAGLLGFTGQGAMAQSQGERTMEQFECRDLMRETGSNREEAVAFLHGFLLGKSGSSKFDIDVLRKQTDDFVERCLSNPTEKALDAMVAIKKQ